MEAVYTQGIRVAERLQLRSAGGEDVWQVITHMGDPKAAFLLIFPFAYFCNHRDGVAVLWVGAVSEWLNLVFKWMLFGERPFWWIGESGLFVENPPRIQQFSSTCETGPGSPSGHAMVTAAVWWVVLSSLGSFLYARSRSLVLSSAPYLFYLVLLVLVGLSRIFILAHFPHQVVAGSIAGFLLGVILNRSVPERRPLSFFLAVSAGLLLAALGLYAGLEQLGVDLSWSISLATKWCNRPEWIRLDTVPFSSLTRDCGTLLGLGLAQYWKPGGWSLPWAPRALSMAFSAMGLHYVNRMPLPVQPQVLFYAMVFVKFVIVPQVVMILVPGLVHLFTNKSKND